MVCNASKSTICEGGSTWYLESANGEYRALIDGNANGMLAIQRKTGSNWTDHYRHPWTAGCKDPGTVMMLTGGRFLLWNDKGQYGWLASDVEKVVLENFGCVVAYNSKGHSVWRAPARIFHPGAPVPQEFKGMSRDRWLISPAGMYRCGIIDKWLFVQENVNGDWGDWKWKRDIGNGNEMFINTYGGAPSDLIVHPGYTALASGIAYVDLEDSGKLVAKGVSNNILWHSTNDNPQTPRVFSGPGCNPPPPASPPPGTPPGSNPPPGTPPGSNPPPGTPPASDSSPIWNPGAPGFFSASNLGMWTYIGVVVVVLVLIFVLMV